jgi:hypothetical protein
MAKEKLIIKNIKEEVLSLFKLLFETYANPWVSENEVYLFKAIVFDNKNFTQVSNELKISTHKCKVLFNKINKRLTKVLGQKINVVEVKYEGRIIELEGKIFKLKEAFIKYKIDDPVFEDVEKNASNLKITNLKLSPKTSKLLTSRQIFTVQQLIQWSEQDLKGINQLGQKRIFEIKNNLKELGLNFAQYDLVENDIRVVNQNPSSKPKSEE